MLNALSLLFLCSVEEGRHLEAIASNVTQVNFFLQQVTRTTIEELAEWASKILQGNLETHQIQFGIHAGRET